METDQRKDEIQKAADSLDLWHAGEIMFKMGAEWSDKHPRKDLIEIDKACKWLEDNFNMPNDFRYNFKRAMMR